MKLSKLEEAIGHKLLDIIHTYDSRGTRLLVFDDLLCQIAGKTNYSGDLEIVDRLGLNVADYPLQLLKDAAIIDDAWLQEQSRITEEHAREYAEQKEKIERADYERLKAKFG